MKNLSATNRTDYVVSLAGLRKSDSILTIGVAHIPEIEKKLENKVKSCSCIDLDKSKIRHAKKYLQRTTFVQGDVTKLPNNFSDKFDTIIMLEVLEHIEDDFGTLKRLHGLLKKGGKLIISVPNKHPLHLFNPLRYTQHKRHYSLHDILSLLEKSGFSIAHTNTVESPKLLFDLYVHLFYKYFLRREANFGFLTGEIDKTYGQLNPQSAGLDSIVVAVKS